MNLYLLTQDVNNDYDTYDSCVVAAPTEDDAKEIHPQPYVNWNNAWEMKCSNGELVHYGNHSWPTPNNLKGKYLGVADENISGIICASFNAG